MVSNSWMPDRGLAAVPHTMRVFAASGINESYEIAQRALGQWRRQPSAANRATLIDTTEKYLDEASAVKQYCTCQTFSLCLPWAYAICHGYIYYALITLSFLLAFTAAFTETYPRNTAKPDSVKITDVVGALIVFAISIAVTIFPRIEKYAYIAAGISGLLHKVAKGYLIARDCCCPKSPILTNIDKFNVFGPAVMKGIGGILVVMSNFASPLPLTGPGELFHTCFGVTSKHGRGLSQWEKSTLLNVLLMGMGLSLRPIETLLINDGRSPPANVIPSEVGEILPDEIEI